MSEAPADPERPWRRPERSVSEGGAYFIDELRRREAEDLLELAQFLGQTPDGWKRLSQLAAHVDTLNEIRKITQDNPGRLLAVVKAVEGWQSNGRLIRWFFYGAVSLVGAGATFSDQVGKLLDVLGRLWGAK